MCRIKSQKIKIISLSINAVTALYNNISNSFNRNVLEKAMSTLMSPAFSKVGFFPRDMLFDRLALQILKTTRIF